MNKVLEVFTEPAKIKKLSKAELVELWAITSRVASEVGDQLSVTKECLFVKIEGNGEVIGDHTISKAKRINFKVKLEEAEELGAVKKSIDTRKLKQLHDKGIKIDHTVTEYLIIKEIKEK